MLNQIYIKCDQLLRTVLLCYIKWVL